jgi:alkylhydroperoxidase family enzyme
MLPEERRNPADAGNVLSTLVRHPKLTRAYLKFSTYLLYGSTLPPRIRELVILRVAHRRDCAYEWAHHVDMGKEVGLTADEQQRMDLVFTTGNYIALAMALNTFGVEVEDGHDGGTQER